MKRSWNFVALCLSMLLVNLALPAFILGLYVCFAWHRTEVWWHMFSLPLIWDAMTSWGGVLLLSLNVIGAIVVNAWGYFLVVQLKADDDHSSE